MARHSHIITAIILLMIMIGVMGRTRSSLYDSDANQAQLEKRFARYRDDIIRLRAQVTKLKKTLNKGLGDASIGISALQESIANERDILFNIQQYLQLPFNYSLCDCYSFSEKQKAKLRARANTLKQSIQVLQENSNLQIKCDLMEQVKAEAARQLGYVNNIQNILNSKCCSKKSRFVGGQSASGIADIGRNQYQTNLRAKNWIYDGMTPSELRLRYFSRAASTNVTNCPIETPFASSGDCINCEGRTPYWSMRLERCVGCPKGAYFNQSSRSCWKTYQSQQNSESYDVVKPIKEQDVDVAPVKGKVLKIRTTTKRRNMEKEEFGVMSPLTGKKITKTTSSTSSRSSKSRRSSEERQQPTSGAATSSSTSTKSNTSSAEGSDNGDEVVSPVRSAPTTSSSTTSRRSSTSSTEGSDNGEEVVSPVRSAPVSTSSSSSRRSSTSSSEGSNNGDEVISPVRSAPIATSSTTSRRSRTSSTEQVFQPIRSAPITTSSTTSRRSSRSSSEGSDTGDEVVRPIRSAPVSTSSSTTRRSRRSTSSSTGSADEVVSPVRSTPVTSTAHAYSSISQSNE